MTAQPQPDAERVQGEVTAAVQRAAEALENDGDNFVSYLEGARTVVAAALDVEEMARVLHADDLGKGFASMDFDDMDAVAVEWYRSGARAVRAMVLGGDK